MVKLSDYTGAKYLKATDCDPPLLLTIRHGVVEEVGRDKEEKVVLYFKEIKKGLVLNKVNSDSLEEITGTGNSDKMSGHQIVCFKTQTEYGGRRVDCIRVRAPKKRKDAKTASADAKPDEYSEPIADSDLEDVPF